MKTKGSGESRIVHRYIGSAGAARLSRVQSAVSHAIANMEAELGVALFDRSGHRPVLTAEGHALLANARDILLRVDAMRARARGLGEGIELELSLVVDTLFPIETVGLRPGEKLHEELFYDIESVEPTESAKVRRAKSPVPPVEVRDDVRRMLELATGGDEGLLARVMLEYAWAHDERRSNDSATDGPEWLTTSGSSAAVH